MGRGGRGKTSSSGGRSFSSGGGSRSFSSRSSGSSGGGRNRTGSTRNSSSGYRPVYVPRIRHSYRPSYGYGGRVTGGVTGRVSGCFTTVLITIVIIIVLGSIFSLMHGDSAGSGSITRSTVEREALPKGSVNETDYFTDELDWINNSSVMEKGMRDFYEETGIQPYVYITNMVNGTTSPSEDDARAFAEKIYDEKFTDEAHLLLIFHEAVPGEYHMWQMGGKQTLTVMDKEATDILYDYLEKYYYSDLDEDEFFSKAFEKAADRIMHVDKSPWPVVISLIVIAVIIMMLTRWWGKAKKRKDDEAKRMEEMLKKPLETFGKDEAENLAEKYENVK